MKIDPRIYSPYKLLSHPDRLNSLNEKGYSPPVFIDLDLTNKCNNKCPLCVSSLISQKKDDTTLSLANAKDLISQLSEFGAKAITFAGGGDPSCHPDLEEIIGFVKSKVMDVAVFTNAYELSERVIESIVKNCTWARISLDADGPEIYKRTHGMDEIAFNQVLENIGRIVEERKYTDSKIVLGACYLVGMHTVNGMYNAAKLCKGLGLDYIRFRPFFNWENRMDVLKDKSQLLTEIERCKNLESGDFSISYPKYRCEEKKPRIFSQCYVPHFMASITADLKVYPCCVFKNNEEYCLGDLKKSSFQEMWTSERRKKVHELVDLKKCPNPCQFEKHGELLWALKTNQLYDGMNLLDMINSVNEPIPHCNFL